MTKEIKHIARPMDAYKKKKDLICTENPDTRFRCEAVKMTGYRSTAEIIREFELIDGLDIYNAEETF